MDSTNPRWQRKEKQQWRTKNKAWDKKKLTDDREKLWEMHARSKSEKMEKIKGKIA